MRDVAAELSGEGLDAAVDDAGHSEGLPSPRLVVDLATEQRFEYGVWPVSSPTPTYAVLAQRSADRYFRCEVYLSEGSQGYSLNGYTREQVIGDILDQYERHLGYLHLRRAASDAPGAADAAAPGIDPESEGTPTA